MISAVIRGEGSGILIKEFTMAKKNIVKVMLKSSASHYFKVIYKNPKKLLKKLSFRKYDPVVRKHVVFHEKKLPSSS